MLNILWISSTVYITGAVLSNKQFVQEVLQRIVVLEPMLSVCSMEGAFEFFLHLLFSRGVAFRDTLVLCIIVKLVLRIVHNDFHSGIVVLPPFFRIHSSSFSLETRSFFLSRIAEIHWNTSIGSPLFFRCQIFSRYHLPHTLTARCCQMNDYYTIARTVI